MAASAGQLYICSRQMRSSMIDATQLVDAREAAAGPLSLAVNLTLHHDSGLATTLDTAPQKQIGQKASPGQAHLQQIILPLQPM